MGDKEGKKKIEETKKNVIWKENKNIIRKKGCYCHDIS